MVDKEGEVEDKKTMVKYVPKPESLIENYREVSISSLNYSISVISSFKEEDLTFLSGIILGLLSKIQGEDKS